MTTIRLGIIGPGTIAQNFADGLAECASGQLVAIASRSAERRSDFGDRNGVAPEMRFESYEAMAASDAIDAIYISTPHPFHAEQAIMALRAGKPVLCEKPCGLIEGEVVAITEVAAQEGVFFMEAFMYRLHPQIARMIEIVQNGEIGDIRHVSASFGFAAGYDPKIRAYAADLAGGGILDVGCYPVSFARLVAGLADGARFADPVDVSGVASLAPTGVDQTAHGTLKFANGITADIACAVSMNMENTATIIGTGGRLTLANPWAPGRDAGPSDTTISVTVGGETRIEELRHPEMLFTFEAEFASRMVAAGKLEPDAPALGHKDSIGNARTLDRWRHAVGYQLAAEDPKSPRVLPGTMPAAPDMPMRRIDGLDRPVSQLVMGCDNRNTVAEGAIVWDAWMEAGGNAFDTGFVYGDGLHEVVLGRWLAARGVADEVTVIVKGAHSPYCTPRAIEAQLDISLERLGLETAPIYIMHRDNPDVPVGEFVDALNRLKDKGKIGIFGGSNWSAARFLEANAHAAATGQQGLSALNNNLSLAVMEKPVWPGCVTSNTGEMLDMLRDGNIAHFSWSSQARGYFLPRELRDRLPPDTAPETCFGSAENAERRKRAEAMAAERGVSAHNVATAWVLAQSFPSFALIGPRSPGEIVSTLPGLTVTLNTAETAWLNLERETR